MSFPKNNLCIVFIDLPTNEFGLSRILFLPLKNRKIYQTLIGENLTETNNVYIRINDVPACVKAILKSLITELSKNIYLCLQDECCPEQEDFEKCLESFKSKRNIQRWIKLIKKTEKNPQLSGKLSYACAFLLNYGLSEAEFKRQFRL
jgi:hypothetical protein